MNYVRLIGPSSHLVVLGCRCMAPELFLSSLLCESLADGEVVVIKGVRRISAHSGYLQTCRWEGFWQGPGLAPGLRPQNDGKDIDVLVMDAQVRCF